MNKLLKCCVNNIFKKYVEIVVFEPDY